MKTIAKTEDGKFIVEMTELEALAIYGHLAHTRVREIRDNALHCKSYGDDANAKFARIFLGENRKAIHDTQSSLYNFFKSLF